MSTRQIQKRIKEKPLQQILQNYPCIESGLRALKDVNAGTQTCPPHGSGRRVGTGEVLRTILMGPLFSSTSLLETDVFSKTGISRKLHLRACSDSLMEERLHERVNSQLREISYSLHSKAKERGVFNFSLNNGYKDYARLIRIDGTFFMTHFFVMAVVTGKVRNFLDCELAASKGKEIPAAKELLRRIKEQLGYQPFDIASFDGLFFCYNLFELVKGGMGMDFLIRIKSDDKRQLEAIEEAERIMREFKKDVEMAKGIDPSGDYEYEAVRVKDIKLEKCRFPLSVTKITYRKLKGENQGKERTTYNVTSANYLSLEDMVKISLSHWDVEQYFDQLKNDFYSRHSYMKDDEAATNLALLLGIAYNVLMLYEWEVIMGEKLDKGYMRSLKLTCRIIRRLIQEALIEDAQALD